jgi:hypothetical protein
MESELSFAWFELKTVDGKPRLLIPWSDPHEYEYAADSHFETEEKAIQYKEDFAPDENWVLCRVILEPIMSSVKG